MILWPDPAEKTMSLVSENAIDETGGYWCSSGVMFSAIPGARRSHIYQPVTGSNNHVRSTTAAVICDFAAKCPHTIRVMYLD